MAKGKGSGAKKEDKASSNAKGKGKGKTGGKDEEDTNPGTTQKFNEFYVRHILCEKYSKKEEALEKLRNGETWDAVVDEYAKHAKGNGGLLGWYSHRALKTPFADVAFALEPSTLTNPVIGEAKTDEVYHIIVVHDRRVFKPKK